MTKWICRKNCAGLTCTACVSGDSRITQCLLTQGWPTQWERVDEPETPLADATFNREDCEDCVWLEYARKRELCHSHEATLQEMDFDLKELKEQVEKLEEQVFDHRAIVAGILERSDDRIQRLEHQMRKHYHGGPVWCETEDGSGTERLVK